MTDVKVTKKIRAKVRCVEMSMQETLHFISEVKLHSCLWDHTHEHYKNKHARDKAWESLSISMGHNADDLFAKWSSLRSSLRQYRSAVKKRAKNGDPDALQVVKWPYYSALSFANTPGEDDEPPAISLPTKLVPEDSNQARLIIRPSVQRPNVHPSTPNGEKEKHFPSKTERPPALVKKRKILEPSSHTSFKPIPSAAANSTTSMNGLERSLPNNSTSSKEPEFIAIKVEALSNPPSPVEQTFCEDVPGCSARNMKDDDEVYGHSIALQMKQFSPRTKRKLRIQIQELIAATQKQAFEKDFGFAYDS
ncbi:uncharacterized protein LOC128718592 [Anopheles marshallii]|uniref:uncharacterized protein LOC128718592 n=1 Tax=Anopheles marshallii TaxID=1521116 RepID=UPI00237C2B46|nr:uncharacterized protein LOC128718592 [Anopheles marshallii]